MGVSTEQPMCNNLFLGEAVTHTAASALRNAQQFHVKPRRQRAWCWSHGGVRWDCEGMVPLFCLRESR